MSLYLNTLDTNLAAKSWFIFINFNLVQMY